MKEDDRFAVAMTRCFFCGEPFEIIMNTLLTKRAADKVKEIDGKVLHKEPCQKCKEWMGKGIMFISVRDGEKGDNPYRTGRISVVKDEAVKRMLKGEVLEQILTSRVAFVDDSTWDLLGLPMEELKRERSAHEEVV